MSLNTVIIDGSLSVPTPVGPKRWVRPFETDRSFYAYDQRFRQLASKYTSPVIEDWPREIIYLAGDPDKVKPITSQVHRLVEEGPLEEVGGGVLEWTRTFARKPTARTEWQSYNWRMPGIETDDASVLVINAAASSQGGATTTIVTTGAHGLSVGNIVGITYNAVVTAGVIQRSQIREVLTVPNGTTITVAKILDQIQVSGGVQQWRNVLKGISREPRTQTVASRLLIEYFEMIPGSETEDPEDIPIIEPETILKLEGSLLRETDSYSPSTTPTAASYRALTGTWICAEPSTVERWKGPFYERQTRYVKAK